MLFRNFLLAALPPADLAVLGAGLTEVNFRRGETLYEPGDRVDSLYFPSSACISIITVMLDGAAVEAATVGRESAVGLMDAITGQPAHMRAFAQVGGSALKLSTKAYRERMLQSPALLTLTLSHVRATALQAEQGVACNVAHDVHGRLARWLLMTQDRTGLASFPLTQEYMAVMTGVQRSTVSMVAAGSRRRGSSPTAAATSPSSTGRRSSARPANATPWSARPSRPCAPPTRRRPPRGNGGGRLWLDRTNSEH